MPLPPEQQKIIDDVIRHKVAAAALHRIHRKIEDDKAEASSDRRFAAVLGGLALGLSALFVAYVLLDELAHQIRMGVATSSALQADAISTIVSVGVTAPFLAAAGYLLFVFPGPIGRSVKIGVAASATAALLLGLLHFLATPIHGCPPMRDIQSRADYEGTIEDLTKCLSRPGPWVENKARAYVLRARAAAHYNAQDHAAAANDLEAAFQLEPANDVEQLSEFAMYLRRAGRLQESLDAVARAQQLAGPRSHGRLEYQRAMTLAEMQRHEDAVAAFTQVLASSRAWYRGYWDRGLSYEKMGKRDLARADFRKCAELAKNANVPHEFLAMLRAKLQEYETK